MTEGREAHLKSGKIQWRYIAQGYFLRVKAHSKVSTITNKTARRKDVLEEERYKGNHGYSDG